MGDGCHPHIHLCPFPCRTSIVRQLTEDGTHHIPAHLPERFQSLDLSTLRPKLKKQATIADLEAINLNPRVHGRIVQASPEVRKMNYSQEKKQVDVFTRKIAPLFS